MRLTDREYCHTIEDIFSPGVVAGFTKTNLKGDPVRDVKKALADLHKDFKVAHLKQIHSTKIHTIKKAGIYEGDGLFTMKENLALVVRTADCLPVFFYSEKLGAIGVVHMGWQGALGGILNNMELDLSSFKAAAGVGLRKCCYALGEEFLKYQQVSPFLEKRQKGLYFDAVSFAKTALIKKGLKKENFFDVNICSFCPGDNFFSYRRDKTSSRTLSFMLKT